MVRTLYRKDKHAAQYAASTLMTHTRKPAI